MIAKGNIADVWMEQKDVQSRIKDATHWEVEWIPIYERRDSYIENFFGMLLPVSSKRSAKAMAVVSWGQNFGESLGQIAKVRLKYTHYLGLRFRRLLALEFGTSGYFAHDQGVSKQITRRVVQERDTGKSDTILARREAVRHFLQSTGQVLLWCVRSQRYSERYMEELELEAKEDWFRHERYCYCFEQMNCNARQKAERPRMETMTQVFGKGIVRLTNEA